MIALPNWAYLFTVDEYLQLGETEVGYTELVEGRLIMSPNPGLDHQLALGGLAFQLRSQLPAEFEAVHALDIDLELVPANQPGFSRRPDLIVMPRSTGRRLHRDGGVPRAADVLVVVELVTSESRRTDNVIKRAEYADAGIPHYWTIDVEELAGTFEVRKPFEVVIDLDQLLSY